MITIFSKPSCVQCDQTKKFLDKNNLEYRVFDVSQDKGALLIVSGMGFKSVPVVVTDDEVWAGYQADKLKALIS